MPVLFYFFPFFLPALAAPALRLIVRAAFLPLLFSLCRMTMAALKYFIFASCASLPVYSMYSWWKYSWHCMLFVKM